MPTIDPRRTVIRNSSARRECIGLVGVGLMGTALAERLRSVTRQIIGWDVAPARLAALTKLGETAAAALPEVFAACDRVVLSLPDLNVVSEVLRQSRSALHRRQIIIDTTTGAPGQTVKLALALAKRGVTYLDATISGNSHQVRAREVTVLVGGPQQAIKRCQDLFQLFAKRVIHTGPAGSGSTMKLVTNLVMGLNRAALAEGLVFARALGLDPAQTLKILRETAAHSRIMDAKGDKMVRSDFKPQARLSQHLKDVRLMLAAAKQAGLKLPLSETHRKLLELAEAAGLGPLDNAAIIRVIGIGDRRSKR